MNLYTYHTSGLRCTQNTSRSLTNILNKINESLFLVMNGCQIWRLADLLVVISQTSRHPFSLKTPLYSLWIYVIPPPPPPPQEKTFTAKLMPKPGSVPGKVRITCTEHYPVTSINTSLAHNSMDSICALINTHLTHLLNILKLCLGEVYSKQHYVRKFVSDLRQVGGFLQVL